MSSSTANPVAHTPAAPPSPAETVIDRRLLQARRHVRGVDLAAGVLRLAVGLLAYLLAFAVLDHWLVTGGFGLLGRLVALGLLLAGAGAYATRTVVPALRYRIHPLFAAQALERGRPGVKNSLINFLMLRDHRQELPPVVYDVVQRRAAADVAAVEVEAAVERVHVFRLGYVLAGMLALCCLYFLLSPKSLVTSAARVLWPFGRIAAPTRVSLGEIGPGNATVYLGDTITVTAVARGLRDDERVAVYFSTADGQLVNQAVPMTLPDGDYRHRAELPPGGGSFQQDGVYFLAAGDFRSEPFRIDVQTPPAIVVDRVVLEYPGYTGLAPRTLRRQGDLQALEGTRATIYAEANRPIRRAEIDLSSDGKHGIGMKADNRAAVGTFTVRLDPDDPTRPQHGNYQLRFVDIAGRANPRPIRHRIEVIRDLPPEVVLLEPKQQQTQVPADGQVTIRVRAEDPDFGLRRVAFRAVSGGRDLQIQPLLAESAGSPGFRGPFTGEFEFRPGQFALKPGDRVLYWAEAEDIRQPAANRAETDRRWLQIADPIERPESDRREPTPADPQPDPGRSGEPQRQQAPLEKPQPPGQPEQEPEQDAPEKQAPDAASPEQPQPDGMQQPEGDERGQGDQSGEGEGTPDGKPETGEGAAGEDSTSEDTAPIDPDTNPGDAIERILEHRRQQQDDQQEPAEQQPGEESGDQQQPQPKDQAGDQPGEPSDGQPAGQQPEKPEGGKPGDGQQKGDGARPGEQPSDQRQPGSGDQPAGQPGDQQEPGPPGSQQEATPGPKPPGTQPSDSAEPQGGPADNSGDQPPGQMQPSPDPAASGAQQQPGPPGAQPQPGADRPSDGAPEPGAAERSGGETGPSPERTEQEPGGDPQDGGIQGDDQMQEQSPGAGKPSAQPSGSPSPQEDNIDRPKKPGEVQGEPSRREEQSPSISPKQSDTEGETAGDRSGGGEEGGGQRADEPGVGSPGSQTDAESGAGASPQQGDGLPGSRGGDQIEADGPTGSSARRPDGAGQDGGEPGGQQPGEGPRQPSDGSVPPGQAMEQPPDGGQPGEQVSEGPGAHGSGSPTQGGDPDPRTTGTTDEPAGEPGAEAANLEFARKQTQLALEYLKNEANQPNSDLLEQLGWSEAEARRFVDQWDQLRRRAGRDDAEGRQARQSLDQAIRSLGLRPRGTELKRGATPTQRIDGTREVGRFRPPADWAEQFEAYTRSIAEGER